MPDLAIIQRRSGERTQELSKDLAEGQSPVAECHVVGHKPFPETLRECYELALAIGADWTLTLDADVMLLDGAVKALGGQAARVDSNCLQIEALVYDKLSGVARHAGVRLYRTRLLEEALEAVDWSRRVYRPETAVVNAMASRGYPSFRSALLVGLHDFEQYHKDLFRTALLQAQKAPEKAARLAREWQSAADRDPDFHTVLAGVGCGLALGAKVPLTPSGYRNIYESAREIFRLPEEKLPLPRDHHLKIDLMTMLPSQVMRLQRYARLTRWNPRLSTRLAGAPPSAVGFSLLRWICGSGGRAIARRLDVPRLVN